MPCRREQTYRLQKRLPIAYEPCLLCISHVSFVSAMSLMYQSCLLCISHVSYVCVMSLDISFARRLPVAGELLSYGVFFCTR